MEVYLYTTALFPKQNGVATYKNTYNNPTENHKQPQTTYTDLPKQAAHGEYKQF